ncbi:hypothetical protein KDAU_42540 [Dictyobacter aurantiacus]|uniref:Uncharacterized protein n=1 Tax=Dictyobacter aurantiacus TaxID=1936993 RepID=A0A401ZJ90_9CHLR|nr:hypothetical protein KDAU_42540 [Dictyobacter aurantiacus]
MAVFRGLAKTQGMESPLIGPFGKKEDFYPFLTVLSHTDSVEDSNYAFTPLDT